MYGDLNDTPKLKSGMRDIADFYNLPVAKAGRLARRGVLPGVFKLGRCFFLDPKTAAEQISARARGVTLYK